MDIDKNEVYLYAEGGGYILRCIPNVTDLNKYRVTEFKNVYIDTYAYLKTDKVYKCKADPNELVYGWAVPYFTLETAMQILIDSAKYIIVTINVLEDNRYEYIIVNKDQLLDQHDYKKMEYTSLIQGKDELKDLYKFEKWSWTISDSVAK